MTCKKTSWFLPKQGPGATSDHKLHNAYIKL